MVKNVTFAVTKKIRRHKHHSVPKLNMASMPDLIFTVLFFFMIVTHMRSESPRMHINLPHGTELTNADHKRYLTNLYIGTDSNGDTHIQIGNSIVALNQVGQVIQALRNSLGADEQGYYIVNIRADKTTPMGIITDVKQELRKVGALTIRYSAEEKKEQ